MRWNDVVDDVFARSTRRRYRDDVGRTHAAQTAQARFGPTNAMRVLGETAVFQRLGFLSQKQAGEGPVHTRGAEVRGESPFPSVFMGLSCRGNLTTSQFRRHPPPWQEQEGYKLDFSAGRVASFTDGPLTLRSQARGHIPAGRPVQPHTLTGGAAQAPCIFFDNGRGTRAAVSRSGGYEHARGSTISPSTSIDS